MRLPPGPRGKSDEPSPDRTGPRVSTNRTMESSPMSAPPRISVIHTSPATVDVFGRLLRERFPEARISNIMDDSILPELRDNGGDVAAVQPRWREYVRIARDQGADVILNACSSIG